MFKRAFGNLVQSFQFAEDLLIRPDSDARAQDWSVRICLVLPGALSITS